MIPARSLLAAIVAAWVVAPRPAPGQDRIKTMPGHVRYESVGKAIAGSVRLGAPTITWREGGKAFEFLKDGKRVRYEIASKTTGPPKPEPNPPATRPTLVDSLFGPSRGRQFPSALSPDGRLKATYRDRNVWLGDPTGAVEIPITTEGNATTRVKCGSASWVYGEELDQKTALWWSPDGRKLAFYRFDESPVKDYYLALDQTKLQTRIDAEPYPKAGTPNPVVDILIYDLASKSTVRVDLRGGRPFTDDSIGHYAYRVSWSADGSALLLHRMNRRQNILEYVAADPTTGACRTIVREEWPASWVDQAPEIRWLADGKRFLWATERTGWKNYHLYDLSGARLATLTDHAFDVGSIVRVDERAGVVDYTAHDGDNPLKLQLHRVGLDGKGHRRLTDPAFHHTVDVAPDGAHFIDVAQTHDSPPVSRLVDASGTVIDTIAWSDTTKSDALGLKRVELFTFKAADGRTDLHGLLHRPSNFDPTRRYPLLVSVYGGPSTSGARETFVLPNPLTEYGFLVVTLDARSSPGRGKRFLDAIYAKLGVVEVDDIAAGVRSLRDRPYLDPNRVGIFGSSYGGTVSALGILRYPEVFHAAAASSAVTDFRLYDTIYTERYMGLPADNPAAYNAGRVMTHAPNLKGRLMIFFGTADNNVHPSNSLQLIQALGRAGKSFEVQVGPDLGHAALGRERMMEFFIEALVLPGS